MKPINRTAGLAAAASLALALATAACGEGSGFIVSPTRPAPGARTRRHLHRVGHRFGDHRSRERSRWKARRSSTSTRNPAR